jgi:class 3 adenylate cyclase
MDHKDYRLAAIMFTDIVGFSKMMESNEAYTLTLMEYHNKLVQKHTKEFKGKIIKTIGDAFLVDFSNATSAVKCAIEIQNDLEKYNADAPEQKLVLRIGVHLGDIYFYENDALGEGINIASRLVSLSNPGRICISQDVYNLVQNKIGEVEIKKLGEVKLKNITREMKAFEILTNGAAASEEEKATNEDLKSAAEDLEKEASRSKEEKRSSETSSESKRKSSTDSEKPKSEKQEQIDLAEIKDFVLGQIKKAGQRLTVGDMKNAIPSKSPKIDQFLSDLAGKGFLKPGGPSQKEQPTSTGGSEDRAFGEGFGKGFVDTGKDYQPRESQARLHRSRSRRAESPWMELGMELRKVGREISEGWKQSRRPNTFYIPNEPRDLADEDARKRWEKDWDNALQIHGTNLNQDRQLVEEYRRQTEKSSKKLTAGFGSHLGSFLGVNAMLFGINLFITGGLAGGFLWAPIVLAAWGIGLISHWNVTRQKRKEAKQLRNLPGLNKPQLRLIRKLFRNNNRFSNHLISNLATFGLFGTLMAVIPPTFPWLLIPMGGMGIGLFSHFPSYKMKQREYLQQLQEEGISPEQLRYAGSKSVSSKYLNNLPENPGVADEAEALKQTLLAQAQDKKNQAVLGDDFEEVLDNYVNQVKELAHKDAEIDSLIKSFPLDTLQKDYEDLKAQAVEADSAKLKKEYQTSIEQIEKQIKGYKDLMNQQKMLKLKISNAMNALRQLQIDLLRVKSRDSDVDMGQLDTIKQTSGELSTYLEDLDDEYRELEQMDLD